MGFRNSCRCVGWLGCFGINGAEMLEASERTKRWGSDVGETTDGILTDMQTMINGTTGQFGLMQQGLSTDTEVMGGDFEEVRLNHRR